MVETAREVHRHYCHTCFSRVVCAVSGCDLPEMTGQTCYLCKARAGLVAAPKSSLRHQRATKAGQGAEDLWSHCHNACETAKIATVWKIPTPTVKGKDGRLIYTAKSTVDFMGHTSTGRTVLAESKSTEEGYFAASIFKQHQRKILDNGLRQHALSLALLACDGKLRVVPWVCVRDAKGFRFGDVGFPVDLGEAYMRRWV